jgi:hypothetical protein
MNMKESEEEKRIYGGSAGRGWERMGRVLGSEGRV